MSPKAIASLGSRSPRTVSHGRQPASRVLRYAPVLRMTAAADRAGSPCGPAGRLALDRLPASATPAIRSSVAEHRRHPPDGITCAFPAASDGQGIQTPRATAADPAHVAVISTRCGSEAGAVAEHRAGDVEQAVGHRAQGARVSVATGAERPVLVVADRIALGGDTGPVVGGVAQPVVGRLSPRHDHALTRNGG